MFVDLWGFGNLVSTKPPQFIFDILSTFKSLIEKNNGTDILLSQNDNGIYDISIDDTGDIAHGQIIGSDAQVTAFSDNIVVTINKDVDIFHVFQYLMNVQETLLEQKILVRGGLAFGDIYHQDNIVFGPALKEAYDLESKLAIYPMIALSGEVAEKANKFSDHLLRGAGKKEKECTYFDFAKFKKDNFICANEELEFGQILVNLNTKICDTENREVKNKIIWLKNYLEENLKQSISTPQQFE